MNTTDKDHMKIFAGRSGIKLAEMMCSHLGLELAQRKAVVLMASQKTLPVALTVLALIPDSAVPADVKGLIAIPCITSHLGQIFIDAVIATKWSARILIWRKKYLPN
mgnify:CR=1 FL=1